MNNAGAPRGKGKRGRRVAYAVANAVAYASVLTAPLQVSCARLPGQVRIMEANFYTARGMSTEAIAAYLAARDTKSAAPDVTPYADYGLGCVYLSLSEREAALGRFERAGATLSDGAKEHAELRFRLRYNQGIVHFERGDYAAAVASFREALTLDGSRVQAKRNLELSLLALQKEQDAPPLTPSPEDDDEGSQALFEYIRAQEVGAWRSAEWQADTGSDLDY